MDVMPVEIRVATPLDETEILALVPRLVEFGAPAWRDPKRMTEVDQGKIREALDDPAAGGHVILVACANGAIAGFIHLHALMDHYAETPHGHISDLVVHPRHEGRGIGRRLMDAAEEWAKAHGYRWLTISVFLANSRAKEMYERAGFGADILRLVKPLSP